jgi:hypothetical protein
MAEIERDERVTQAYRALGDASPPAALDQAILAASRRRGGRWYVPVSAAAVLVLAVAVAVVVEREAPKRVDDVAVAPQVKSAPAPAGAKPAERALARPEPSVAAKREAREAPASRAPDLAKSQESAAAAAPAAGALVQGMARAPEETPAHWLERIAKLRADGRDKEADEGLAEFRRRYPDYEIPKEMRARVLPR